MPTTTRLNQNRNRNPSGLRFLIATNALVCLVAISSFWKPNVAAFQSIGRFAPQTRVTTPFAKRPTLMAPPNSNRLCADPSCHKNRMKSFAFHMASPDSEDKSPAETNAKDNFDGEGFAGYLLPYAAALIGSLLATAAIFKFVLLDY